MSSIIKLENITKSYGDRKILNSINLDIPKGEYVSIIGESGAGKSTLLNIIGALDKEFEGEYWHDNKILDKKSLIYIEINTLDLFFNILI